VDIGTRHPHYCNNFTRTTKYTLLTFFPKSLFEQVGLTVWHCWWGAVPCAAQHCVRTYLLRRHALTYHAPRRKATPCIPLPQYRRLANIYFTLVAALSLTAFSPVRWGFKGVHGMQCTRCWGMDVCVCGCGCV